MTLGELRSLRFLIWILSVLFLMSSGSGCVFCRRQDKDLKRRFEKLCEDYKAAEHSDNCTHHPEPYSFNIYGVDENSLLFITQKTHRVFRVFEITRDRLGIAAYWDWLHEVKLMDYSREALCPPVCKGTSRVYNCTLCVRQKMKCWSLKTCYPDKMDLYDSVNIVMYCSAMAMALVIIVFCYEYYKQKESSEKH